MKTIGLIDHYLNEFHALNYPDMIDRMAKELGVDIKVKYAYAEVDHPDLGNEEICDKLGLELCDSLEEVCQKSDYLILLFPDHPHLKFEAAKKILKYKKPTFIDKTFMKDYAESKEIFDISKKEGTPMFTSSSLRFASEFESMNITDTLLIIAPACSAINYWVHPLEMLLKIKGTGAKKIRLSHSNNHQILQVRYADRSEALILMSIYGDNQPYMFCGNGKYGESLVRITSPFFDNEMKEVIKFFIDGTTPVKEEETLELMKIRDLALLERFDEWLDV